MRARIVVVGGGFAGFWAAIAARRVASAEVDVALISAGPQLEMRPRLYEASPENMAIPIGPSLNSVGIEFTEATATGLDLARKRVTLTTGGEIAFDRLVIATGSCLQRPPVPGADSAHSIDSLADALAFDRALAHVTCDGKPARIAILGAGFTGIELALELRSRIAAHAGARAAARSQISLIDRAPKVGPTLGSGPRPAIAEALRDQRIDMVLGATVVEIRPDGLVFDSGAMLDADLTVLTTGSVAAAFAQQVPGRHDSLGRIVATQSLRAPDAHPVFVAGDAVVVDDGSGHAVMQSCQHALQLGRYAGENAARDLIGRPVLPFRAPTYVTCLDLGGSGAVFTKGWDRRVEEVGRQAKLRKERINRVTIYPPLPSRPRDLLACSSLDPREQTRALYA